MARAMFPVLSIDIGGSKLMTAISEVRSESSLLQWRPLRKAHRPLPASTSSGELLHLIHEAVEEVLSPSTKLQAIGINVPGLADPKTGVWVYACFSGIRDFPIAEMIRNDMRKPVFIENDVNACALAEKYFGACQQTNDFLWVTISNGVGGGLVLGGNIFSGSFGNAGEIGHFCVEENEAEAIRCGCGNFGCLEAQAAGPGIAKRYQKLTGQHLSAAKIAALAKSGDQHAQAVYHRTGYYLGKAIASAANLLNLEKVILGGGVSHAFDLFFPELEKTFHRHVFLEANRNLVIEPTHLGGDAALAGAAAIAFRGLQSDPPCDILI